MSARHTGEGAEQIYAAAERWVDCALRTDGSLFTPGQAIWTAELLGFLHERFLDQPDTGGGGFFGKLPTQLAGGPAEAYQLMGEALYVYYLPISTGTIRAKSKESNVKRVLEMYPPPVSIPPELTAGFEPGLAGLGRGLQSFHYHIGTLIETVEQWKEREAGERESLLKDPWAFKDFLYGVKFRGRLFLKGQNRVDAERHFLLHILFPDYFESSLAGDKNEIAEAADFASFVAEPTDDIDRQIYQIRQGLEAELGRGFSFYNTPVVERWRGTDTGTPVTPPPTGTAPPPMEGLQALAAELYLPDDTFLKEIQSLLVEKGQVIFQGPPGTGKTYVARALAKHLAGSGDDAAGRVRLVQFHPSYAYEDFVQGFRPKQMDGGQVGFELRDGPLLEIAEKARNSDKPHYLIIDEINRGNLATVFGELYFLLEYRDTGMRLQYSDSDEDFKLPENLFIIGTMNTADRSIARVDLALRRRFYFVEFLPEEEPVKGLLGRYLEKNPTNAVWVVDVVDKANGLLKTYGASDAAIGPSYFMQEGLTPDKVALIWKHSVLPYIADRLFNDRERLAEFDLEKLRNTNVPAQTEGV